MLSIRKDYVFKSELSVKLYKSHVRTLQFVLYSSHVHTLQFVSLYRLRTYTQC